MNDNGRLTLQIKEAAPMLGISSNLCYKLARLDKLPVPVIFLGEKRMCVSRKAVEKYLEREKPAE